jgi:hypothetical protein
MCSDVFCSYASSSHDVNMDFGHARETSHMCAWQVDEIRRLRAAYGFPLCESIGASERREIAKQLLAGTREYDLSSATYEEWRAKYG